MWMIYIQHQESKPTTTLMFFSHLNVSHISLNAYRPASLYQTFGPEEARWVIKRLEFHHIPKQGSWHNMAEIDFSVFGKQCLNRRIDYEAARKREIAALEIERNQARGNHRMEVLYRGRPAKASARLSISFKLTRY